MRFTETFLKALNDYRLLLGKEYPKRAVQKLVGDQYRLSRTERNILYRGISPAEESTCRWKKLVGAEKIFDNVLTIDALNQLYTLMAYLNGKVVFISTDGFLRDASSIHGRSQLNKTFRQALELSIQYMQHQKVKKAVFYIDEKVNHSNLLAEATEQSLSSGGLSGQIIVSQTVDQDLMTTPTGIVATSDSQIIKKSNTGVFDLAIHVLKFNFTPNFLDLRSTGGD